MHKQLAEQQSSNELPKNQLQLHRDMLILVMLFLDPAMLWQFMHSHRYAYHLAHHFTAFQRAYLLRHVTTSEITIKQILTLPSQYHALYIGGFAYHVQRAAQLWDRIPKPQPFWQRCLSYFIQEPVNHHDEWLTLVKTTTVNYDILLRSLLLKSNFLTVLTKTDKAIALLNYVAQDDHLECFKLLYELIDHHAHHRLTSTSFSRKTLHCFSSVTNFVNTAMVYRTLDTADKRLDVVYGNQHESDEIIEQLTQLVIQRIGTKSRILQYLLDTMRETKTIATSSRQIVAQSLLAFCNTHGSHAKDLPELLILQIVELFRNHANTIFTDYRTIEHCQVRLFLTIMDRCDKQLPDQFDLYLLHYARELVNAKIFTAENLSGGTFMQHFVTKLGSLRAQQVENFTEIRKAKIAILTDIWQTLSLDEGPRSAIVPVTTFDTGPYLQRTVRSMINERRKLMHHIPTNNLGYESTWKQLLENEFRN